MLVKDTMAMKFTLLALHMLVVCISIYARDANVSAGLALDVDFSSTSVDSFRKQ